MDYSQKVIWLTGASSGIGEALAYALSKKDARLILSARRTNKLQQVKAQCANHEQNVRVLPLDLTETNTLAEKTTQARAFFGSIDMLINNSGISQRSLAVDTDMKVIRQIMDVNFFGTVALTKAVLPDMLERQNGHIVVISSVMGKLGTRLRSTYAASKHALHGYFDSLRQEVSSQGVAVTLVCPGFIKTDITVNAVQGDGSRLGKMSKGQQNGMAADDFAHKLLQKLSPRKNECYIGGKETWGVYLKRFSPKLLNAILRRTDVT